MKVVILCGGKGTRIRDLSEDVPKPMIPIDSHPILWHIMRTYAHWGYKEFILCLGYKGAVIKDFFLNYRMLTSDFTLDLNGGKIDFHRNESQLDWKISFVDTGVETQTGSRVSRIRHLIGDDEDFMLTYGDGLSDVDITAVERFHRENNRIMTICGVRPPGRFGELEHDAANAITEFNEKPQTSGGRISGGFFVCKRALFDHLDETRDDEILETEPMRSIARDGQMVMYPHDGFWQCMDTRRDYQLLSELTESGRAPWIRW